MVDLFRKGKPVVRLLVHLECTPRPPSTQRLDSNQMSPNRGPPFGGHELHSSPSHHALLNREKPLAQECTNLGSAHCGLCATRGVSLFLPWCQPGTRSGLASSVSHANTLISHVARLALEVQYSAGR